MTRLLTRSDLAAVLTVEESLRALSAGFAAAPAPVPGRRFRSELPFDGTAVALLPGLLPGVAGYTVKVNAKFPAARPALRGVIALHAAADGELLALMDSGTVTAWRTGLAAALATHRLARPDPDAVLGVVGAGAQAETVIAGLRRSGRRGRLLVCDVDPERATGFAARHNGAVADTPARLAARADIVVTATWSRETLLTAADLRPGAHVTALGADEPGKRELSADLLAGAVVVVDDRELAATTGALAAVGMPASTAAATFGEVVRGEHPGRVDDTVRTVYAPVGLPWQDLAIAWPAWRTAVRAGVGSEIDLLG